MDADDRRHIGGTDAHLSLEPASDDQRELRSAYGSVPGEEFSRAVYRAIVAAFGAILVISWLAFGGNGDGDADLALGIATVLTVVFFALPILLRKTAAARLLRGPAQHDSFLHSRVEVATGTLGGAEVWLQILIIPLALAFAAAAIGAVYAIVA
jgi:hypothetical protein